LAINLPIGGDSFTIF